MLTTPGGSPASSTASASRRLSSTVSGLGLITAVQPAASRGASLNMASAWGKFQGTIAPDHPDRLAAHQDLPSEHPLAFLLHGKSRIRKA